MWEYIVNIGVVLGIISSIITIILIKPSIIKFVEKKSTKPDSPKQEKGKIRIKVVIIVLEKIVLIIIFLFLIREDTQLFSEQKKDNVGIIILPNKPPIDIITTDNQLKKLIDNYKKINPNPFNRSEYALELNLKGKTCVIKNKTDDQIFYHLFAYTSDAKLYFLSQNEQIEKGYKPSVINESSSIQYPIPDNATYLHIIECDNNIYLKLTLNDQKQVTAPSIEKLYEILRKEKRTKEQIIIIPTKQ
jgi:hypothetical protein